MYFTTWLSGMHVNLKTYKLFIWLSKQFTQRWFSIISMFHVFAINDLYLYKCTPPDIYCKTRSILHCLHFVLFAGWGWEWMNMKNVNINIYSNRVQHLWIWLDNFVYIYEWIKGDMLQDTINSCRKEHTFTMLYKFC